MRTVVITLDAKTAHEARREIAQRWPEYDVYYWGYTQANPKPQTSTTSHRRTSCGE